VNSCVPTATGGRGGAVAGALAGCLLLLPFALATGAAAAPPAVPPGLRADIEALLAEKAARTPVQQKIGSRLLYAALERAGRPLPGGLARGRPRADVAADGSVAVDVRGALTERVRERLAAIGGRAQAPVAGMRRWRARLPLDRLEDLAALPEVEFVAPADRAYTRKRDTSEGDVAHFADLLRSTLGVDGSGVGVGVLSDGVGSLGARQATGDLPPVVTVLAGQAGSGSEGTAMLEIVHDLAPGASLYFATAFNGQSSFAANILALRAAGADVIVDDVGYFAEAAFQDDDVAAAVDTVVADGALYYSAGGNGGNLDDGTSGVWEGDYVDSGDVMSGSPVHDFGGAATSDVVTADTPYAFTLQWSDPLGGSANDYDLLLLDPSGTQVYDASTDSQNGSGDAFELIDSSGFNDAGNRLMVLKYSGAPRMLRLDTLGGRLSIASAGQLYGHPGARGAVAVAAVDVADAGGAGGRFDGSEPVETYSSDGPRRIHYEADGTPITPGDLSSTGGEARGKPDLAGADCVSTATPGFSTFCGTSAAAPHAAAVAAVLLERAWSLGLGPADVDAAMRTSALDIESPGSDRDSGAGLVHAQDAGTLLELTECQDGIDNDGDGLVDHPADPGCDGPDDPSEHAAALPCDDGLDDDGDGLADYPADPGCRDPEWPLEDPQCQDGIDNDGARGTDFDGGESVLGTGLGDPGGPDPDCAGIAYRRTEYHVCGAGGELVGIPLALLGWRRRRRRSSP